MNQKYLFLASLLMVCLGGCDKSNLEKTTYQDALVVKTVNSAKATRADNGIASEDGTLVFPIGSVFVGGGVADPKKGASHRCHFYTQKFTEGPLWNEVDALVTILGFRYTGVEYKEPGSFIDQIYILLPKEVQGIGSLINIPMEQGKYKGGNDLIRDVQIKSYQFASMADTYTMNKDSDINIVITTTAGDKIYLVFNNDVTPYDGYY